MKDGKLISEVTTAFNASRDIVQPLVDRRKFNLDLYTGYDPKFKVENVDNITSHVPYVKNLLDNVLPLLTAKMPVSKVTARDSAKNFASAKLMDRLVNYTFDVNKFEEKYMMIKKESALAGDAFVMVIWSPDPEKNHPIILHLNTDDVFPHVAKLDIDDEWPIFIRRELTKEMMKDLGWDKQSIGKLSESNLGSKSLRKEQLRKLGISSAGSAHQDTDSEPKDDLYEVVIRLGMMNFKSGKRKMGMVVVANDEEIINPKAVRGDLEPFESPYRNNVMPIAKLPYDPLPHSFFSQSFIDPIMRDQVELNDLENMKRSNYNRRNNPPLIVDPAGHVDLSTLKFLAGMPWVVKGGKKNLEPFILDDLAPSILNDQKMIMARMQNVTGASDFLNPTPDTITKGNKSATHANIMNENTKMRFRPQAVGEDRFMEKIGKLLINLWQDPNFFNEEVAISMVDDEGQSEVTIIENGMVQGDLDFVVSSASSIAQSDTAVLQMAVQVRELFTGDQTKNLEEIDRTIIEKSGFDPNKVINPKAGAMPSLLHRLRALIFEQKSPLFKQLPPNIQAQKLTAINMLKQQVEKLQAEMKQTDQPGAQPQPQPGQSQAPQQAQPMQQQLQPQA